MCKIIDFQKYAERKKHFIIRPYSTGFPKPETVRSVELYKDLEGDPSLLILADGKGYEFKLTNGFQIHICNEFLRELNSGIDVHFKNYKQYGHMLMDISEVLFQRWEASRIVK